MKRKLKINIVLPFLQQAPGGGLKVMYQYANQLANAGHSVVIYHSMYTSWTQPVKVFRKNKHIFLQKNLGLKRERYPKWFAFNSAIKSFEVPKITDDFIRNADIMFGTWWATAIEIDALSIEKGKKFNLIQDYEAIMTPHKDLVHRSYQLNMRHMAVSNYLAAKVAAISGKRPDVIPNAVDIDQFFIETAIERRNPESVCMLYADAERKGSKYGIEALKIVAEKYPDIKVSLFGVYDKPKLNIPKTFKYYHLPENIRAIYNDSAIFISPSIHEGWGLPPMEAMACGCACICTKIEGHLDFMTDAQTAILVEPANPSQMAESIISLIKDNNHRLKIAYGGNERIQSFSWEKSSAALQELFYREV
ncbi:MAG: glycosyltransferase family 4 protein [Mucilaginibacter sp.]